MVSIITKILTVYQCHSDELFLDDVCRNWTAEHTVFRGYSDGVSGFSVWGQNVISISKNKIGISSLRGSADEVSIYMARHMCVRVCVFKHVMFCACVDILLVLKFLIAML